jgi:hypothetical protein
MTLSYCVKEPIVRSACIVWETNIAAIEAKNPVPIGVRVNPSEERSEVLYPDEEDADAAYYFEPRAVPLRLSESIGDAGPAQVKTEQSHDHTNDGRLIPEKDAKSVQLACKELEVPGKRESDYKQNDASFEHRALLF